jgi:hypothetical protein
LVIHERGSVRMIALASMPTISPGPYSCTGRVIVSADEPPASRSPVICTLTSIEPRTSTVVSRSPSRTCTPRPWRAHGRNEYAAIGVLMRPSSLLRWE